MSWIQTYSGKAFYFDDIGYGLSENCIIIEDIAHSLSLLCRFNGHCKEFYSVADHSILVAEQCSLENKLSALLHDVTEVYLGDVTSPLKSSETFSQYREWEGYLYRCVANKFHLPAEIPEEVKIGDARILADERINLMNKCEEEWTLLYPPFGIEIIPLTPEEAEIKFLEKFNEYSKIQS